MTAGEDTVRFELEGREISLTWHGFTSAWNLHKHFMKHVARLDECDPGEREDPERWTELWSASAPLEEDLSKRRADFKRRLVATLPRCALARLAPAAEDVCAGCDGLPSDDRTLRAVGASFRDHLEAYEGCVRDALMACLREEQAHASPRYFFTHGPDGSLLVEAVSPGRIRVSALARSGAPMRLAAITGYRPTAAGRLVNHRELDADFQRARRSAIGCGRFVFSRRIPSSASEE
ncbi:MAG TPA: hypothetical protein PK668_20825 [Myxococcota bacterium]|nr:hypothetical protein [Myxococcota bacterium]HRY96644.1 hypothetical protein [Myxococcota bacterium]